MARQRGVIKLQRTVDGITFVNSKRYEPDTRAARGTHKKAKVNGSLQHNADNAGKLTSFGSPVLRELKALEKVLLRVDLWSRMTARMFKTKSRRLKTCYRYGWESGPHPNLPPNRGKDEVYRFSRTVNLLS